MSGTVGTLSRFDDALFPGARFVIRDDTPPPHATRCETHQIYFRGETCPMHRLEAEEAVRREETAKLFAERESFRERPKPMAVDGDRNCDCCGARLRGLQLRWCSDACRHRGRERTHPRRTR